jgi:DNA-binding beta-propeller fold protein YncE
MLGKATTRMRGGRACRWPGAAALVLALLQGAIGAHAQTMIVGNDEKAQWDEAGKLTILPSGKDTIAIYGLKSNPAAPRHIGSLQLENSVVGPPTNLAVTPNGALALVANSVTAVADGDGWKTVPDNRIYVIDLKSAALPKLVATLEGGKQPSGMAISRKGDLALVTNRADNTISVLAINGREVKLIDSIAMGDSVAAVAISPDGTRALAIKPTANKVAILSIEGQKVSYDKYDVVVGVFPYNIEIAPGGKIALVNNNGAAGAADGNVDTVSVIDLEVSPPRVIDFVLVGDGPEGLAISPRGNLAVSLLLRGSNSDRKAFYYHKNGSIAVLKISGKTVTKVGEVEVGGLPEGIGFSPDGKYLYVGNMSDGDLSIFKVDGTKLIEAGKRMKTEGHPASLRIQP